MRPPVPPAGVGADPVEVLRARTPARVLVGRAGPVYRTATQLGLREDQAEPLPTPSTPSWTLPAPAPACSRSAPEPQTRPSTSSAPTAAGGSATRRGRTSSASGRPGPISRW
jgi:hypothetical protein